MVEMNEVNSMFCVQFLEDLKFKISESSWESLDLEMQVNFVSLLGSRSRTRKELSPDGLHFCGVSAISNFGVLGRVEYGKSGRNISSSNSRVCANETV